MEKFRNCLNWAHFAFFVEWYIFCINFSVAVVDFILVGNLVSKKRILIRLELK